MARRGARRTATRRRKRKIKNLESDTSDDDYELEEQQDSSAGEDEAQATLAGKQQESIRMPEEQSIVAIKETPLKRSEKNPRHGGDDLKAGALDDGRRKKAKETVDDVVKAGPSMQDSKGEKEKGKEKIAEEDEKGKASEVVAEVEEVCGICLVEEGKADRGRLDCCDHFFCYTCIMEWAKVESRCPMCKQRFIKIVRPATTASGRSRTVRIPLRNQVYIPPEEEISQYEDPYANVACMECHEAGDERFLLLCDSCDAAAHTYCVGLGRSVPRGDWFCRSCQAFLPQSSPDDEEDLILGFSSDDEDSLIRAIVATPTPVLQQAARHTTTRRCRTSSSRTRPRRRGVRRRLWRRLTHNRNTVTSSFIFSQCMRSTVREASETIYNSCSQTSTQPSGPARTVPDQRRLQERIQFIRENWEEIRRGARQFPTGGYNTSPSPLTAPSSKEKTSNSLEPQSKSGDSSCTLEDNSRNAAELARGFQAREITGCKKEDLADAWDMLEQAKILGEGSSSTAGPRGTGKHLCSFDRQEGTWSSQNARYSSKTSIAPKQNIGVRLQLSTDRQKVNNVSESPLEPIKLGGNSGAGETSHSKLNDGNQNHRKEGTAVSSSKKSENIETLDIVFGRKKDIQSSCSTQVTSYFKCLVDHNHANSQVIDKDNVDAGWSCLQSPEAARSSDFRTELSCSVPSSGAPLEVPNIYLDHHSSAIRPNSIATGTVTEVKNKNGKELPSSHERFGLGNANVCLDSRDIVCKSLVDVADSKTTSAVGSNGNNHEEWRTDCKVASASASKCDNVQIADKTTKVEVVKNHVANLVKAELWPIYISKGLGKEQFKEIARSATHALLAVCGLKHRKSDFPQVQVLPCCHRELQTQSVVANYCDSCFKVQVQAVVRTVADNHNFDV